MMMGLKWTLPFLAWILLAGWPQQAWSQMLENNLPETSAPSSDITTGVAPGVSTTDENGHTSYTILPSSGLSPETRKWAADKTSGADYHDRTIPGQPTPPDNPELAPKPPENNLGYSPGHNLDVPPGGSTMNPDGHTTYTVNKDSGISPATQIMMADKTARGANYDAQNPVVTGHISEQGPDTGVITTPSDTLENNQPEKIKTKKPKKKGHPFRTLMKGVGVGLIIFSVVSPIGMPSFGSSPCH